MSKLIVLVRPPPSQCKTGTRHLFKLFNLQDWLTTLSCIGLTSFHVRSVLRSDHLSRLLRHRTVSGDPQPPSQGHEGPEVGGITEISHLLIKKYFISEFQPHSSIWCLKFWPKSSVSNLIRRRKGNLKHRDLWENWRRHSRDVSSVSHLPPHQHGIPAGPDVFSKIFSIFSKYFKFSQIFSIFSQVF